MTNFMRTALWAGIGLASLALVSCQSAMDSSSVNMAASLSGANEVPPKPGAGTGMAKATLNKSTKMLSYEVTFSGLSGPATAAHFHGPAEATANAGVAVPITGNTSPMTGSVALTDAQMADLLAGKWYVNIHTAANPPGEIRGQVRPAM